jgi:RNA polymerase sigma-70 factor (ECF subfamily)
MIVATGNPAVASDVADEAFVRTLERWRRVRALDFPLAWTFRVAINLVRRTERRRSTERRALARLAAGESDQASASDFSAEVWAAIQALPVRMRTAVALRYIAGLTDSEAADAMGVAMGTIARHLHDARERLAVLLDDNAIDHTHSTQGTSDA